MPLNPIDLLVLILSGIFFVVDGVRGFIRSVSLLLGIVVGFWVAGHYAGLAAAFVEPGIPFPYSYILAFVILFILSILGVYLVGLMIKYIFRPQILRWADHLLGCLLGIVKGFVLAAIILVVFNIFHPLPREVRNNSYTYRYLTKISEWMMVKLPKKLYLKDIKVPHERS